ncbi:MAG: hypothetical protein IPG92_15435 [Flavobacteriales bacterium]|nr:hypothetical protein [Flavobacteriales bacterium]
MGHTNSFGQEAGSPYSDVYIARLASDGSYLWGKSIGTENTIDEAFDIIETQDSSLWPRAATSSRARSIRS